MKYSITIAFETDKELSGFEQESLINSLILQVEEPQIRVDDESSLNTAEDAEWSCVNEPSVLLRTI